MGTDLIDAGNPMGETDWEIHIQEQTRKKFK